MIGLAGYLLVIALVCVVIAACFVWAMDHARVRAYADGITDTLAAIRPALAEAEEELNDALATLAEGRAK